MPKVCLDPGHVGFDSGAVNRSTGLREADVTLAVMFKLARYLANAGITVVYTRTGQDVKPRPANLKADLALRCKVANDSGADLFVSIHCNSAENPAAQGFEVYTAPGQGKADLAAEAIVNAWESTFKRPAVRKDLSDGDSDKEANFYVLLHTHMPAVLVELAFISNPDEERLLRDLTFQEKAAQAIAQGIVSYFGLQPPYKAASPPPAEPRLAINGTVVTDVPYRIIEGHTWVQLRPFAERLGCEVGYDERLKLIRITKK